MASMSDIKRSIRSIRSTQQITKAMKMVSASKLRRAQANVIAARPYADKIQEVLGQLTKGSEQTHPLLEERETQKVLYVLVTGDSGLCGGFNANNIKMCEQESKNQSLPVALVAIGKKGRDYFARRNYDIAAEYIGIGDNPTFIQGKALADQLTEFYLSGEYDEIHLIYSQFRSAMSHVPLDVQLLPIVPVEAEDEDVADDGMQEDFLYEPDQEQVLSALLPAYVETLVYRMLLESKASEHGARMTAMAAATDNATEIIQSLTLAMNRARQAAITTEITEIVGGAAALE